MKKSLLILLFVLTGTIAFSKNSKSYAPSVSAINQYDTVFFDLIHSSLISNYIEIPVFFRSDDVINALDFAMKFDLTKLEYDSTIVHRTSMSPLANYNPNDSTLRLTSFDLQAIPNDTLLVTLRFKLLNGTTQIHKTDFNSIAALLNGDPCTGIVIEQTIPSAINNISGDVLVHVYPNPATDVLNVSVSENTKVQILTVAGQIVFEGFIAGGEKLNINTSGFPDGNYLLRAIINNKLVVRKFTLLRMQ